MMPRIERLAGWASLLALGCAAAVVLRMLHGDWESDPQYAYGWLVPLLVAGLALKRWEDRPAPAPEASLLALLSTCTALLSALVLALLIPVSEAAPGWRPVGLFAALSLVALMLSFLSKAGGIPWVRHFAFPACFFLIAVPWPRNFEQSVMSGLMGWNSSISVEALHWLGFQALSSGNLVMLPCGILGIEEACSGVRSLQSGLMAALFFGEVMRLAAIRRICLLGVAVLAALLGNACRNTFLAVIASTRGMEAVGVWHDTAGMIVLLVTMSAIIVTAFRWRRPRPEASRAAGVASHHAPLSFPSAATGLAVLLMLFGSLLGTEAWFRMHELVNRAWSWDLLPRTQAPGVSLVTIPPETFRMLHHPTGFSERWIPTPGHPAQVFFFEWPAGRTTAAEMSMHNPEVCLGSIGMKRDRELPPLRFTLPGGGSISFRSWIFEDRGTPVYVFHGMQEPGFGSVTAGEGRFAWLEALRAGRRSQGERMIEVAFWNLPDEASAVGALRDYLDGSLRVRAQEGMKRP